MKSEINCRVIKNGHWLLWVLLFALCLFPGMAGAQQGPIHQTVHAISVPAKVSLPFARIVLLDAGMYAGLVALWPHAFAPDAGSAKQMRQSWSSRPYMNYQKVFFELDDDPWVINGVLHGLFGSEIYLAGRTVGHTGLVSFLYAMFASVTWEYLVEGWFHTPSAIDLAWTPFAGAVLGEFRYQMTCAIQRRSHTRAARIIFTSLVDPVGQIERAIFRTELICHARR